jgi:acetyl esterase/lipase
VDARSLSCSGAARGWSFALALRAARWARWAFVIGCLGSVALAAYAAAPITVPLWPQGAPEPAGFAPGVEHTTPPRDGAQTRLMNVALPSLAIYRPEEPNGTAVVVAPGGAYLFLAIEHEGTRVCERLVAQGVTCALLRYRVPARTPADPGREALQDAQRAMGWLRRRADEWQIRADRIGFLGFSAGGHLAVQMAFRANARSYPFDRALDVEDATPNFVIPIYPAYLLDEPPRQGQLRPDIRVPPNPPPMCLVHAGDDDVAPALASALLVQEYHQRKGSIELHLYAQGGHGFGLKPLPLPAADWLVRVLDWMRSLGLVPR